MILSFEPCITATCVDVFSNASWESDKVESSMACGERERESTSEWRGGEGGAPLVCRSDSVGVVCAVQQCWTTRYNFLSILTSLIVIPTPLKLSPFASPLHILRRVQQAKRKRAVGCVSVKELQYKNTHMLTSPSSHFAQCPSRFVMREGEELGSLPGLDETRLLPASPPPQELIGTRNELDHYSSRRWPPL